MALQSEGVGQLDGSERDYLLNVLNEVIHGFVVNFRKQLGCSRESVVALYQEVSHADRKVTLSARQARLLIAAAGLCEVEFEGAEFASRLGFSKEISHQLVADLEKRASLGTDRQTHVAAS